MIMTMIIARGAELPGLEPPSPSADRLRRDCSGEPRLSEFNQVAFWEEGRVGGRKHQVKGRDDSGHELTVETRTSRGHIDTLTHTYRTQAHPHTCTFLKPIARSWELDLRTIVMIRSNDSYLVQ